MARRPFNITRENFSIQRYDIDHEGVFDFFKNIGRSLGMNFDDIHSQLEDIKNYINKGNKEIKNENAFSKCKLTTTFGIYSDASFLIKDLPLALKDLSYLHTGEMYEGIMQLGHKLNNENREKIIDMLLGFITKELKRKNTSGMYVTAIDFYADYIKEQLQAKPDIFTIPIEFVSNKGNKDYCINFNINYSKDPAAWLVYGPAKVEFDYLVSYNDNSIKRQRDKLDNTFKLTKFQEIEAILKALSDHADDYRSMYNNSKNNIRKIQSVNDKYLSEADDLNESFTIAMVNAYKERLSYLYRMNIDMINVVKYAIGM